MKKFALICLVLMLAASVCLARGKNPKSDTLIVDVDYGFTEAVSVFCLPDGSGNSLTRAFLFGGMEVDASLTVSIRYADSPVSPTPAEAILLVPGGNFYHLCGEEGAVVGTGLTDENGEIVLDGIITGGGYADPSGEGARIVVEWDGKTGSSESFPLYMNSADINGDGSVDLLDISAHSSDMFKFEKLGKYNYRSDLNWDGAVDMIDGDIITAAYGASCH